MHADWRSSIWVRTKHRKFHDTTSTESWEIFRGDVDDSLWAKNIEFHCFFFLFCDTKNSKCWSCKVWQRVSLNIPQLTLVVYSLHKNTKKNKQQTNPKRYERAEQEICWLIKSQMWHNCSELKWTNSMTLEKICRELVARTMELSKRMREERELYSSD